MTGRMSVTHQEWVKSFTAEKYILGELSSAERDQFEEHYFECPECADAVRCLGQLQTGTKAGLCREADRVEVSQSPFDWLQFGGWQMRPQAALAGVLAAVSLAAVVGYQSAQFTNQLSPHTVQSLILLPATRGELPMVQPRPAGPVFLLEADLPGAVGNLAWSVRSSDGRTTFDGVGPSPEPGHSFKVLVLAARLEAGEYTFTVRSDAGNEWLFRFRTGPR